MKLLKAPDPDSEEFILMRFWKPALTWFYFDEYGINIAATCEDANDNECIELPVFIRRETK